MSLYPDKDVCHDCGGLLAGAWRPGVACICGMPEGTPKPFSAGSYERDKAAREARGK